MKVAVITPYYREPAEILRQCHESVAAQTFPALHVLVADGHPRDEVDAWNADHVRLPRAHGDIGSTPRLVGCYHAIGLGCDAVAFLDADNCYAPDHVESLADLHRRTGAEFLSSTRYACRPDLSVMGVCPFTDPEKFIDTNCMMFTRGGFGVLHHWTLMPDYAHLIGDKVMLHHVRQAGLRTAHSSRPTVLYRCSKAGIYQVLGEPVPPGVGPRPEYEKSHERWVADGHPRLMP